MASNTRELIVSSEDVLNFKRLDQYLTEQLNLSRSNIKQLFTEGLIYSDIPLVLKKIPPIGTTICVQMPSQKSNELVAENIELDILFEDDHLIFINKPAGLVIHPAPGNATGTLVNALLGYFPAINSVGDPLRPGIVHRLDKGTSGVMIVAKTNECHKGLVEIFSGHNINRVYECIIVGRNIPHGGTLKSTIGRHPTNRLKMAANVEIGKEAITHYKLIESFEKMAHMKITLETGRTHQIRVHMASLLRCPILMDQLYGNPKQHLQMVDDNIKELIKNYEYPFLHAKTLGLIHPITGATLEFSTPRPEIFETTLNLLKG